MMTAEATYCERCGDEMDQDCMGNARCPACDGPCPCCHDGGVSRDDECCACGDYPDHHDTLRLPSGEAICDLCLGDRYFWERLGNGVLQVAEYHGCRVRTLWLSGSEANDVERKLDAAQAEGDLLELASIWDEYEHLAETH